MVLNVHRNHEAYSHRKKRGGEKKGGGGGGEKKQGGGGCRLSVALHPQKLQVRFISHGSTGRPPPLSHSS